MSIYDSATRIRLMAEAAEQHEVGDEEGTACNRMVDGERCFGEMVIQQETCTCWINAPCGHCLDSLTCATCGYRLSDDNLQP